MSTYTGAAPAPTDPHPTVPLPPGRWTGDQPHHPHRRLYAASVFLGVGGLVTLVIYILEASEMHPPWATLLACLVTTLVALAGVALMLGYSVQTRGDRDQALHSRICTATASVREDLDALGQSAALLERLEGTVGEQSRAARGEIATLGDQLSGQLSGLEQRVIGRIEAIEQRQDELDERVEDTVVVAEALGRVRSNGHGNVHQLQPPGPRGSR